MTKIVLAASLKKKIFLKFYFTDVSLFMFSYFEPNFIEKFFWKSVFSHFDHMTIFAKWKLVYWPLFWNVKYFELFCCWFTVVLGVNMVQVPCQNSFGKTVVSLTPSPLCTNGSQKYLKILSGNVSTQDWFLGGSFSCYHTLGFYQLRIFW